MKHGERVNPGLAPPLPLTSTTGDVETVSTLPPFAGLSFKFGRPR